MRVPSFDPLENFPQYILVSFLPEVEYLHQRPLRVG